MSTPAKCQKRVYHSHGAFGGSRCSRNAVRDGYCTQHHPDAKEARRKRREEEQQVVTDRWRAEHAAAREQARRAAGYDACASQIGIATEALARIGRSDYLILSSFSLREVAREAMAKLGIPLDTPAAASRHSDDEFAGMPGDPGKL